MNLLMRLKENVDFIIQLGDFAFQRLRIKVLEIWNSFKSENIMFWESWYGSMLKARSI